MHLCPIIYALTLYVYFVADQTGHAIYILACRSLHIITINCMFLTAEKISGGMVMVLTNSWLVLCMLHNVLESCAVNKHSQCVLGKALF